MEIQIERTSRPSTVPADPSQPSEKAKGRPTTPPAAMLLGGVVLAAVLWQGGYRAWQHQWFGLAMLGVGAVLLLDRRGRVPLALAGLIMAPIAASTAVSYGLSADRSNAGSTWLTLILLTIALAAGLSIPRAVEPIAHHTLIVAAAIVAASGIWGVATHTTPWGRVADGVWRGSSFLTYSNAAASVIGAALFLVAHKVLKQQSRSWTVVGVVLVVAFGATQSRAGAAAVGLVGLVAVAVWVRQGIDRLALARTSVSLGVGGLIGAAPLLAFSSTEANSNLGLCLGGLVVAPVVGVWLSEVVDSWRRLALAGVALVVLSIGAVFVTDGAILERLSLRSPTADSVDQQVLFGDRSRLWAAASEQVGESPWVGHGPGVVELAWVQQDQRFTALFVHNEYLELAMTHGLVGLVGLALSAALVLRLWRLTRPKSTSIASGAWLAIGAFMFHSTFDFLWHIPALPVLFAFVLGDSLRR